MVANLEIGRLHPGGAVRRNGTLILLCQCSVNSINVPHYQSLPSFIRNINGRDYLGTSNATYLSGL